jgi:hypothetical protein
MATPLVSEVFESDAWRPVRSRGLENLTDTNYLRYIGTAGRPRQRARELNGQDRDSLLHKRFADLSPVLGRSRSVSR